MSDNKLSPPGLKIFIQKQHPVLHSSSLKPCFKPASLIDSVSSRCWRHRCWSLKAPLPLLFLFSIPTVFSRLHCFPFSSSSHCVFHCKTLLLLNPLLQFFFPAPFFFFLSSSFLHVWLLHSYWWGRLGSGTPWRHKEHSYIVICVATEFIVMSLHYLESTGDVELFCIPTSPRFSKLQKLVMAGKRLWL